jgi:hypothetical protein
MKTVKVERPDGKIVEVPEHEKGFFEKKEGWKVVKSRKSKTNK